MCVCVCLVFLTRLQSVGNKNGKLWTTDEEVSPEVLAKVSTECTLETFHFSLLVT